MSSIFTSAVIGLGNIGQNLDYDAKKGASIITHASAFDQHQGFQLVAGVDPNDEARRKFEDKFEAPAFATISEMYSKVAPQVVSICTPSEDHATAFELACARGAKAILCEKPFATTLSTGREMLKTAEKKGCLVLVNYIRRFDPGALELKRQIQAGAWGDIYKGTVWYAKGMLNNGSHYIDLLMSWFGDVKKINLISKGRVTPDKDLEPDLKLQIGEVEVFFLAGREECFSVKEMELMGTRGRIEYRRSGSKIQTFGVTSSADYPGYRVLETEGQPVSSDLMKIQYHVVDALHASLEKGVELPSSARTALKTLEVVEKIRSIWNES